MVDYRDKRDELSGDWINQHPIEWQLQREETNTPTQKDRDIKLYFGPGLMFKIFENGNEVGGGRYELDTKNQFITFIYYDGNKERCKYIRLEVNSLQILRHNVQNKSIVRQYFWRRVINEEIKQLN